MRWKWAVVACLLFAVGFYSLVYQVSRQIQEKAENRAIGVWAWETLPGMKIDIREDGSFWASLSYTMEPSNIIRVYDAQSGYSWGPARFTVSNDGQTATWVSENGTTHFLHRVR